MYGDQWRKFIADNILSPGDMLVFAMKPTPKIYIVIVQSCNCSSDDSSDEESSGDDATTNSSQEEDDAISSEDESDDDKQIVVAQRARLTTHEKNRLAQLLLQVGPGGLMFVTRLTSTNVSRHDMVCVTFHFHGCFPHSVFSLFTCVIFFMRRNYLSR